MERDSSYNSQPIRELEWLAYYFTRHGNKAMAKQIFEEVKKVRERLKELRRGSNYQEKRNRPNFDEMV